MSKKEFFSVKEVCEIIGLSRDRIYEALRREDLQGKRIGSHGSWRIPVGEIERFMGTPIADKETEAEAGGWSGYIDLALGLDKCLTSVTPGDWSVWGLADTGKPPLTSEAGIRIWLSRGQPVVMLAVEADVRFNLFIVKLKHELSQFAGYDTWRSALGELMTYCWHLAQEILAQTAKRTGLRLTPIPMMGKGHLLNVPRFVYESAMAKDAGSPPALVLQSYHPERYILVPDDQPRYILAKGSQEEMELVRRATVSLLEDYSRDERFGEIDRLWQLLKRQADPIHRALAQLIESIGGL